MTDQVIEQVVGRRVWDSRGRPTVEAEIRLSGGRFGRAIAPAGASTGAGEALDLRDGGDLLKGYGVSRAVAAVNGPVNDRLRGMAVNDQTAIDRAMIALDGTQNRQSLGGNAMIAVSMAAAHAAASATGDPLYRALGRDAATLIPMPEVQIIGGGAHAAGRVDLQDFMAVPVGAGSFDEAMVWIADVYRCAGEAMAEAGLLAGVADEGGFWPNLPSNEAALDMVMTAIERAGLRPGEDVALSLDIAADQLRQTDGTYALRSEGRSLAADEWCQTLAGWCARYPVVSIEDPVAAVDMHLLPAFRAALNRSVQLVGDDLLVTSARRVVAAAAEGAINCLLVKPNQAGTLTETREAFEAARSAGMSTIISARSGETEDVTIAHLAVGWEAGQLKVGSFSRSERMAKWNEILRIEEALGGNARFAGREVLAKV